MKCKFEQTIAEARAVLVATLKLAKGDNKKPVKAKLKALDRAARDLARLKEYNKNSDASNAKYVEVPKAVDEKLAKALVAVYKLPSRKGKGDVNHTGGAFGADSLWAAMLRAHGVVNNHYRPLGNANETKRVRDLKGLGDNVVAVSDAENKAGLDLNTALGNSVHLENNRNLVQVYNADKVFAVAPIKSGKVQGGTGSAVRMAEALKKDVYVLDTSTAEWFKSTDGVYVKMAEVPDMRGNIAAIGTRDIEKYYGQKEGKYLGDDKANKIVAKMQETVDKSFKEKTKLPSTKASKNTSEKSESSSTEELKSDNVLVWNDTAGTVMFKDGKTKAQVTTFEQLVKLSEDFEDVIVSKGLVASWVKFTEQSKKEAKELFEMLGENGIEFQPLTLGFKKALTDGSYGLSLRIKSGEEYIDMSSTRPYDRHPMSVIMHEYVHTITAAKLNASPALRNEAKALMEHVLKENPALKDEYGMVNEYEFIAEAISNPEFQDKLSKIKPYKTYDIVDRVKLIFKKILSRLEQKDVSALNDALAIGLKTIESTEKSPVVKKDVVKSDTTKVEWNKVVYEYDKDTDTLYSNGKETWKDKSNPQRAQIVDKAINAGKTTERTDTETKPVSADGKYELFPGVYTNKGQTEAINKLKTWWGGKDKTFLLKGRGGTGKTTIIAKALEELNIRPTFVAYAAFTNKAVGVLEAANGKKGKDSKYLTTAQILRLKAVIDNDGNTTFQPDPRAMDPISPDTTKVLVIDEASMLPRGQQLQIEQEMARKGIKIIYMGDDVQLPPVNEIIQGKPTEVAKVFEDHIGKSNFSELSERMRQGEESPILPITDAIANAVYNKTSLNKVAFDFKDKFDVGKNEGVQFVKDLSEDVVNDFVKDYKADPAGTRYIHYNAPTSLNTVAIVNRIRQKLFGDKYADKGNKFFKDEQITFNAPYETVDGEFIDNSVEAKIDKVEYKEAHVVVYKHGKQERSTKMKGYVVTATDNTTGETYADVFIPDYTYEELRMFKNKLKEQYGVYQGGLDGRLANVGHAYVISAHKSQGSTYNNVYANLSNIMSIGRVSENDKIKAAYVATSRPRKKLVVLHAGTPAAKSSTQGSLGYNPEVTKTILKNREACS